MPYVITVTKLAVNSPYGNSEPETEIYSQRVNDLQLADLICSINRIDVAPTRTTITLSAASSGELEACVLRFIENNPALQKLIPAPKPAAKVKS